MASSAKPFSLFLLITLLTTLLYSTHARENQFFNKASTTNTNNDNLVPDDVDKEPLNNQPDFLPENENGYGLSGHNSVQLPPSATTESKQPLPKYLPRNYNPVAYVTEPEDTNTFAEEKSYYNNGGGRGGGERNYYYSNNNQQQEEEEEEEPPYRRSYPDNRRNSNNYHYGGGSSFNSEPQGLSDTSLGGGDFRRPQGMSDTRSLENGKYYYDINTEKYNSNHPYERLKAAARARNEYSNVNRNNYRGYESNGRDNSVRGYRQNGREDQLFQDEGYNNNLP
ncbi:hypothetical protein ACP275_08G144300 [Erythranthe tilingii]